MHLLFGGITSRIEEINQTAGSGGAIKATVSAHRGSKSITPTHNEHRVADVPLIDNIKGKFQVFSRTPEFKAEEHVVNMMQHLNY